MAINGTGETAATAVIRAAPTVWKEMKEAGVALVPAYFFARPDDPVILETHAAMGFAPEATALVLNMNSVDSAGAFDAVRAHPAYKAALERGAVERGAVILADLLPRLERFDAREHLAPLLLGCYRGQAELAGEISALTDTARAGRTQ